MRRMSRQRRKAESVSEPFETRLFIHRLTQTEKAAVYVHNTAFPSSELAAALASAVEDVCVDKLIRADGCLKLAQHLALGTDNESLRAAISRAYYCIHHCLRAIALWQGKWDPDGHEQSIEEFWQLLKDTPFRVRLGLPENTGSRVAEARTNRHVADYSPYDFQRTPPDTRPIGITNGCWSDAVQFNISLAEEIFQAAMKRIGS